LLILVLTPRFVHESRDPEATGRFDLLGVPAGTLGVALLLLAVVQGGDWGYRSGLALLTAAVGLVFVGVLVYRSMVHPRPLLDLELFRFRSFWSAATGQVFFGTAFIAIVLFNTLLLQELWGWSALAAGFGVVPGPALAAILGGPVGSIADRVGHRNLLVIGSLSAAASPLLLLTRVGMDSNYLGAMLPASLFLGVGVACSFATFASLGLKEVPTTRYATASATLRTTSQVGFASGVAIAIAVFQAGTDQGFLMAFDRAWTFMAVTLLAGAAFCAVACPSRDQVRGLAAR